ncbi:MAG: hypothetical protein KC776_07950 [Myxococcales bacterium]|nr:hypothetical protein [Myxococcales bacterium]MCB9577104.1 GTPase [Polyangiaceae bacterium]
MSSERRRVLVLGAAGRDFHDFQLVFRDDPGVEVVAFTAAQLPNIAGRRYPAELAGKLYPSGIPILEEAGWEELVRRERVDEVVFAYSDVPHGTIMDYAERAVALGADFRLLGTRPTMLRSEKPVVSVCAVRTGVGKSPTSRYVARTLREMGKRVAVVRHPMPYGDLAAQAVQRFATLADMAAADCTIEEREEYEPHVEMGGVVFAGVDYERILRAAEAEADVVLWDGGNNDLPFFVPDLEIVLVDPHRPGDELAYYPGEANLLRADVVVLTKLDSADPDKADAVRRSVARLNPGATVVESEMPAVVEGAEKLRGARALVIEDGPTLTHGGMRYGAGVLAARAAGVKELVDPRPHAVGSLKDTFARYPHLSELLPAMGYGKEQVDELSETIRGAKADVVVVATPVDLGRILRIDAPVVRVRYDYRDRGTPTLADVIRRRFA